MEKPKFSIIIPTHNGAERIHHALSSVASQTFRDYEVIVICDACEDNTAEIAKSYGAKVIKVNHHRDGLSRNAGLDAARGDWILFLDDDDWYLHEYVLQLISDELNDETDMLDYGIVWKTKGVFLPDDHDTFGMITIRAWRREFIGGMRFADDPYGSDSRFFDQIIKRHPRIRHLNTPVYYYNYMRPGSMTDDLKKGITYGKKEEKGDEQVAYLDIIITHYNEPWEVGKKLFTSIAMQECCKMTDVNFILVQDGKEGSLDWDTLLSEYPFKVKVVTLDKHAGVSNARNAGISAATAEWIMFMDFDDVLADVATLAMLTRLFPITDDLDIVWSKYTREVNEYGRLSGTTFNCEKEMNNALIGRMYRRAFLNMKQLRFLPQFPEYSTHIFNILTTSETYPFKIANFYAEFYPFFKRLRMDGAFSTIDTLHAKAQNMFARDAVLVDEMQRRGLTDRYRTWLIRAIADVYHSIQSAELEPDPRHGITDDVIQFWQVHRDEILRIPQHDIEVALDESQTEAMTYIQEYYNNFHKEYYLQNDMISFNDFIHNVLDSEPVQYQEPIVTISDPVDEPEPVNVQPNGRAVVYCGTENTYISMVASVKSLLATTPVDKVYFLIEDDVFPYDLPDIVETINVKDNNPFDPNGPNYVNAWTYMCLMRTAYPQMFPQYDKILSLDIDVVITEDISELWDIDMTDYYFSGVEEQGRAKQVGNDYYANFGVIMMNLKKLREDGMGEKLVAAVNTEHFGCPEQDAFNRLCKGHIHHMPNDYNVTVYSHITGEAMHEKILHYAGLKYWKHFGPVQKYYNLSWDEIMSIQRSLHG